MHLRPTKEDNLSTRDKIALFYIAPKFSSWRFHSIYSKAFINSHLSWLATLSTVALHFGLALAFRIIL